MVEELYFLVYNKICMEHILWFFEGLLELYIQNFQKHLMEECYNNNICIRFERNSTETLICHANNLNKHSNDVS